MFRKHKKLPILLILIGCIIIGFGLVFIAQSGGLVGPSTSFMYENAEWAVYGSAATALGIIVFSIGLLATLVKRPLK